MADTARPPRPAARRTARATVRVDPEAFGRLTERIARFLGTGRYLVVQTVSSCSGSLWNTLAPDSLHFDPTPSCS